MAKAKKPKRRLIWIAVIVGGLIVAGAAAWFVWSTKTESARSTIDTSKYQAVFLDSGHIYFGKLKMIDDGFFRLSEVFYIQSNAAAEQSDSAAANDAASGSDMKLIKLGEEVHGPEDEMVINRDRVRFFENLKSDSKVSELIRQYKSGGK